MTKATLQECFDSLSEEQKEAVYLLVGEIILGETETPRHQIKSIEFSDIQWRAIVHILEKAKEEKGK